MTAIVDIWNMALSRVGHSTPISDPDTDITNAANLCRTFYPMVRDQVLEDADWNFARKRVAAALLASTVTNWAYCYAYPADCVKVRSLVLPGARQPTQDERVPFEIANVDDARVILTDMAQAELIYTRRVENPNLFTAKFTSAVGYLLGSEIAVPLTGKPEMANSARNGYVFTLGSAETDNLNEREQGPPPDCDLVAVRQ